MRPSPAGGAGTLARRGKRGAGTASLAALLCALLGVSCSRPSASPSPSPQGILPPIDRLTPLPNPLPDVVARVNGREIPLAFVEIIAKRILASGDPAKDRPFAYRQATQQLVIRELLLGEAVARDVKADDSRVEQAYDEARVGYKDDRDWGTFLANQGLTVSAFRDQIRTQLTVQALLDQEAGKVVAQVSDEEARAYYDANPGKFETGERLRASHILLRVPEGADAGLKAAVRQRAQGLLERLRRGADFAQLAKEHSEDAGSKGKGGRLDDFSRGQLAPPFEAAAFALKPGETSDVVETPFGYHIIRLLGRVPSEHLAFEPNKERVKEQILAERRQRAIETLVSTLRAKARIETYL